MWTLIVLIFKVRANKDAVTCDARFTANGGPYDGASMEKEFVYTHPTSAEEVIFQLTEYAADLKISFNSPGSLEGTEWEV